MRDVFPILEFDDSKQAIIEPSRIIQKIDMPEHVVLCFFNDVIERLRCEGKLRRIHNLKSEMGLHPIYEMEYADKPVVVLHPGIGAPLAAGMMEEVIALGGRKLDICCQKPGQRMHSIVRPLTRSTSGNQRDV